MGLTLCLVVVLDVVPLRSPSALQTVEAPVLPQWRLPLGVPTFVLSIAFASSVLLYQSLELPTPLYALFATSVYLVPANIHTFFLK